MKFKSFINKSFLIFTIISIFSCSDNLEKMNEVENIDESPDVEIFNFQSIYNTDKLMKAKVTAPVARNFATSNEPYMEFPDGLKTVFYDEYLKEISSLTANYTIYYTTKKLWKATGNVYIENIQGGTLQTEELFVDEVNKKIYSVKYVKVTDADGTLVEGKGGFVSNFEFTEYEFKDVSGILEQEINL